MKTTQQLTRHYAGIANPSGAVALSDSLFIVGDDEDNLLRIYDRDTLDKPLQIISLSHLFKGIIKDGPDLEIDIESMAAMGNVLFIIGSHSTSRTGEYRPARHRLIAIQFKLDANNKLNICPVGEIHTQLIDNLKQDVRFKKYRLDKAAKIPPKAIGGLSIEGLAATPDNGLLIGFRNPLSGGKMNHDRLVRGNALLVKLKNPFEVIHGLPARFAKPIELDLDGQGIREITWRKKHQFMIVAGPYHENIASKTHPKETGKLYHWFSRSKKLKECKKVALENLNIEAAFFYPEDDKTVQLLSDDGQMRNEKKFRSQIVKL
ncbi:MAG: DUF3616 domain-containing protein [Nitrosomonas sp.]|nr:DUF3616 domain-containing protein [Nitrosomonas sp.]